METVKDEKKLLIGTWKRVRTGLLADAETFTSYLPLITVEEIDEIIETIDYLYNKTRSPNGFAPIFHISKSVAITNLTTAINTLKKIENGEFELLRNFLNSLVQIISGFHTMLMYGSKDKSRKIIAEMGGELAESLSLIDTAQKELSNKLELLSNSEEEYEKIKNYSLNLEGLRTNSQQNNDSIQEFKETAEESVTDINTIKEEIESLKNELNKSIEQNNELLETLNEQSDTIENISEQAYKQKETIESLLPKGASAGLASAFGLRVKQINNTKWVWMALFIISIISLVAMSAYILSVAKMGEGEIWKLVLQKLPFTLPLVWLGWFSAIQYGNTILIQEDYAFKEATSKAFQGYRDHMEHLAKVDQEEAYNAMNMLSLKTIEILANEPLRIYQKSHHDASPSSAFFNKINFKKKSSDVELEIDKDDGV
jgi:hypothetical protein